MGYWRPETGTVPKVTGWQQAETRRSNGRTRFLIVRPIPKSPWRFFVFSKYLVRLRLHVTRGSSHALIANINRVGIRGERREWKTDFRVIVYYTT